MACLYSFLSNGQELFHSVKNLNELFVHKRFLRPMSHDKMIIFNKNIHRAKLKLAASKRLPSYPKG